MNYGMQVSASGALTNLYRMDVLSNNLANIDTVGFKPDFAPVRQRDPARVEDGVMHLPSSKLLERLGGGVAPAPNVMRFEQGPMTRTGNPLDLAVSGDGFFMLLDTADSGADRFRLTRDGRFTRSADGTLVSATTGMPLLDTANRPIRIDGLGEVVVDQSGMVRQGGRSVAQIQLVSVPDPGSLKKVGHGMFQPSASALSQRQGAAGSIEQYTVEGAAVDPIRAMMGIADAGRAVESNFSMIANHDRLMDRAINGLGRVSA